MPGETSEVEGHCMLGAAIGREACTKPWQRKCTIHADLSLHG